MSQKTFNFFSNLSFHCIVLYVPLALAIKGLLDLHLKVLYIVMTSWVCSWYPLCLIFSIPSIKFYSYLKFFLIHIGSHSWPCETELIFPSIVFPFYFLGIYVLVFNTLCFHWVYVSILQTEWIYHDLFGCFYSFQRKCLLHSRDAVNIFWMSDNWMN